MTPRSEPDGAARDRPSPIEARQHPALRHLAGLDALATHTLRVDVRDDAVTIRGQPTPEPGDAAAIVELVPGPLREVWRLAAEGAAADKVGDW